MLMKTLSTSYNIFLCNHEPVAFHFADNFYAHIKYKSNK